MLSRILVLALPVDTTLSLVMAWLGIYKYDDNACAE